MIPGIFILIGIMILFIWPNSSSTLSQSKPPKMKTSELSTEVFVNERENDLPPIRSYSYTENSSEIGLYRRNNQGCNNREAASNIKIYDNIFVNRDRHMKSLTNFRIQDLYYIAVITGPPGFGKSRLAIQWGIQVAESGTDVRYEDLSHSSLHTIQLQRPTPVEEIKSSLTSTYHARGNDLLVQNGVSGSNINRQMLRSSRLNIMDVLLEWSKTIQCPTVLILDNVDDSTFNSKSNFLDIIDTMIKNGNRNLHIIVTSQYKLIATYIDQEHVYNLTLNSSLELIGKLNVTSVDVNDAALIAELVGGCPLALRIVASLLRLDDYDSEALKHELQSHPIKVLSNSDVKNEQLQFVFGISFKHLVQVNLHNCAYSVSLFPGSFSEIAGNAILSNVHSQDNSCHKTLLRYSLLEKYWVHKQSRFEMHRLLREYARKRGHNDSHELQRRFNETFSKYFVTIMKDHALFLKEGNHTQDVWDEHQFSHSLENLNIQYLLQILVLKNTHSLEELQVLAFAAYREDIISFMQIKRHYHEFVSKINEVCDVLVKQDCEDVILHTLRNTCKSSTWLDHVISLFIPCGGMFDCNTLQTLHNNKNIWIHLTGEGQIYLRHLEISYCKPLPFLNFHFPWPSLFLIGAAELAIMPTIINNPPTIIRVFFMFASMLSILDIACSCYNILWCYPDQDDVIESCITYIAEIMIYLTCFVTFVPRIFIPNCRMYNEDNLVKRSHIFNSLFIVLLYVSLHYAFTSYPNILSYIS